MRSQAVFIAMIVLSGCGLHGRTKVSRKAAPTAAPPAASLQSPGRVIAPGIVEAWGGEVSVAPREPGWIAQIGVEEGQHVDAGQTLAVLDDDVQRAAVDVAKADLAEAEAAWARTFHGATADERRQAAAETEASRARAALARSNAQRLSRLGEMKAAAPADVERATAEADTQIALAEANGARLTSIERGARNEDRALARARLAAAQARLQLAQANLARRRIQAPITGVVLTSRFHAGEFFAAGGNPLFVIGDVSRLRIRLEIDEIDAARVEAGAPCSIFGDDNAHLSDGTVFRLAPRYGRRSLAIEAPTARADVRVREVFVEVAPGRLIPGQRVWGHTAPINTVAAR